MAFRGSSKPTHELSKIELERFVSLGEAARLRNVSPNTIRRNLGNRIVRVSPKRYGIRLKHVLMLDAEDKTANIAKFA